MTPTNRQTILVVDDEPHLRSMIAYDLEKAGYSVVQAANGNEAFKIVKEQAIDLVVSDVRMPSGTGPQLLESIRSVMPDRPSFIFMTAFADISSDEALNLGAEAFLRKPLEKDELLEEVKKALVPRAARWSADSGQFDGARKLEFQTPVLGDQPANPVAVSIGQGGLFLAMEEGHPACYEVVEFDIPFSAVNSGRLAGHGCVRWVRHEPVGTLPAGIGLEFAALTEASLRDVVEYLGRVRPKAYVPLGPRVA